MHYLRCAVIGDSKRDIDGCYLLTLLNALFTALRMDFSCAFSLRFSDERPAERRGEFSSCTTGLGSKPFNHS